MRARFPKFFIAGYGFLLVIAYFVFGAFSGAQSVWHDLLFHLEGSAVKAGDSRLILLAVDDDSGKEFGFPLPRVQYARALDKLKALGVKTVVFDVMFFEPRPGDGELAAATRRFGRVVHLFSQDVREADGGVGAEVKNSLPVSSLRSSTKFFGYPDVTDLLENDGRLRRFNLVRARAPDPYQQGLPSLSLEASTLSAYLDKSPEQVLADYGRAEHALNFRRPRTWLAHEKRDAGVKGVRNLEQVDSPYRRIPITDLLNGQLSADQRAALKGSIVIIGSTALGYYDHYPTPFAENAPGAEFHLNAIDNVLNGDALTDLSSGVTVLAILAAAALPYFLLPFTPAVGAGLAAAALAAWFFAALALFRHRLLIEFVPPAFAFVSSYLVLSVYRALTEGAEKRMIKALFGQFVAPEIVDKLAQDPSRVKLGGEKRDMTVFFLDIAHFTNISEKMDPQALIHFLNRYLSALSHVILERHGTIDKYIGDCIMAFWNAPIENKDHRSDAILAALECQAAVRELNKSLDPGVPEVPEVRIGINSGVVTVGLTGSEKKLQYTVIGDEVNLASRLEGANKFFGSKIIVSESVYEGARERVSARTLGRVRVVGKATPIRIYEPIGETSKLSPEWKKGLLLYEAGVAAFDARRYAEALEKFKAFAALIPDDGPGALYLERCREYARIPPDAAWEGVFNLTAK